MSAVIESIDENSIAEELEIRAGDVLISMNQEEIHDVIDYMYYSASEHIEMLISRDGEMVEYDFEKDEEEPLGLNFPTYLIEKEKSCKNKCIFCFIDQLPKNLRSTLYFKDDDARLSFLMGNYITLTNLSEFDIQRIIRMKMSPINISVHTTDPDLRVFMMKNPNARNIMTIMKRFAEAGIVMNCQIVLCRGVNDGPALDKSLHDLYSLYPAVNSVSIVPVGLSDHREGLEPLRGFDRESSKEVIAEITSFGDYCKKEHGRRLFYASDEFYIMAGLPIPSADYYDGYPQIENGVGLCRSLSDEVEEAVQELEPSAEKISCGIITGVSATPLMKELTERIRTKYPNLHCEVYTIINHFFGENITVAGLVVGKDIVEQLKDTDLPEVMYIPSVMLRAEGDLFLDSMSLEQVEQALGTKIVPLHVDGHELVETITGQTMY